METPMIRPFWTKEQSEYHRERWREKDITVLICQRKTPDLIRLCLSSLLRFYPDIPVLVVDGDSQDESSLWLKFMEAKHPNVKVWNRYNNLGGQHSSHGDTMHDAIMWHIETKYVLMLDSDTIVERGGWIETLLSDLKSRPENFALGTMMLVTKKGEGCGPPKDENDVLRYGHPSCCMINRDYYIGMASDAPFLNHGAPCYKTMIAAADKGYFVDAWPVEHFVSHLSGSSWTKPRTVWDNDHDVGEILGIINIEILTAGYDSPSISCVILACPTKAWKKYIQCCGRGIRLYGNSYQESIMNGKSDCILLDCASAIAEHGLPDQRKVFKFRPRISKVVDRQLKLDENSDEREEKLQRISVEKKLFLKKIGSVLDLYENKEYKKESELQEDVNKFLERTGYFWWRQNSGKAFIDGRWVHFASKAGLPDNTVFYKNSSFYFGLEIKTPKGKLTEKQKETLPEMISMNVLFFIVENVLDVYSAIEHIEKHTDITDDAMTISKEIYRLPERQVELRTRLKLPQYSIMTEQT